MRRLGRLLARGPGSVGFGNEKSYERHAEYERHIEYEDPDRVFPPGGSQSYDFDEIEDWARSVDAQTAPQEPPPPPPPPPRVRDGVNSSAQKARGNVSLPSTPPPTPPPATLKEEAKAADFGLFTGLNVFMREQNLWTLEAAQERWEYQRPAKQEEYTALAKLYNNSYISDYAAYMFEHRGKADAEVRWQQLSPKEQKAYRIKHWLARKQLVASQTHHITSLSLFAVHDKRRVDRKKTFDKLSDHDRSMWANRASLYRCEKITAFDMFIHIHGTGARTPELWGRWKGLSDDEQAVYRKKSQACWSEREEYFAVCDSA